MTNKSAKPGNAIGAGLCGQISAEVSMMCILGITATPVIDRHLGCSMLGFTKLHLRIL